MKKTHRLFNLVAGETKFEVKAKASDAPEATAHMYLYDEIGDFGITASDFVSELAYLGGEDFNLHVNSPGGDVFAGLAMLNTLRAYPGKVTATVDGIAASAASFILCGADEVVMSRNSELMIHDAWGACMSAGNAADMRTFAVEVAGLADRLDMVSDNIADVYASKAGGDPADWRAQMKVETWFSAASAVEAGLADRVTADETVVNALAYDLARFKNHTKTPEALPAPVEKVSVLALLERAYERKTK